MVLRKTLCLVFAMLFFLIMAAVTLVAAEDKPGLPPQARMPAPAPEKGGLASLYPGDEGIERDPRVLFVEDFETGTPEEIGARWGNITKKENFSFSSDLHGNSPGTRSILSPGRRLRMECMVGASRRGNHGTLQAQAPM